MTASVQKWQCRGGHEPPPGYTGRVCPRCGLLFRAPPERCPKCGDEVLVGYGLMGGGIGPYKLCDNEKCDFFEKVQEPIEESD